MVSESVGTGVTLNTPYRPTLINGPSNPVDLRRNSRLLKYLKAKTTIIPEIRTPTIVQLAVFFSSSIWKIILHLDPVEEPGENFDILRTSPDI